MWGAVAITYKLACPLAQQTHLDARIVTSAVFFAVGTGLILHVRLDADARAASAPPGRWCRPERAASAASFAGRGAHRCRRPIVGVARGRDRRRPVRGRRHRAWRPRRHGRCPRARARCARDRRRRARLFPRGRARGGANCALRAAAVWSAPSPGICASAREQSIRRPGAAREPRRRGVRDPAAHGDRAGRRDRSR